MSRAVASLSLALTLALAPATLRAESFRCQTAGYCTNELACFDDSSVFLIETDKTGLATFGWDDPAASRMQAQGVRLDGIRVWHRTTDVATQTLVLADNLQATFSVSGMFPLGLYTSIQALTCQRI